MSEKKSGRAWPWLGAGVLLVLALSFFTREPPRMLTVSAAWDAASVRLTNRDDAAAGTRISIYINGTPPSAYRADVTMPAAGETIEVPLSEFVTKAGDRFNPVAKAVTVVWVGGGGYDYTSYAKRR